MQAREYYIIEKQIVIIVINSNRSRAGEKVSLSGFSGFSADSKKARRPVPPGLRGSAHALLYAGILFRQTALNKTAKVGNDRPGKLPLSGFVSKCEWENFSFSQSVGGKRPLYSAKTELYGERSYPPCTGSAPDVNGRGKAAPALQKPALQACLFHFRTVKNRHFPTLPARMGSVTLRGCCGSGLR